MVEVEEINRQEKNMSEDQNRYTSHEIALITILIKQKVNLKLWNGDTIKVDKESNSLTDIKDKSGKELLRIFNHIEYNRIVQKLRELKK